MPATASVQIPETAGALAVPSSQAVDWLAPLPLQALHGIGPAPGRAPNETEQFAPRSRSEHLSGADHESFAGMLYSLASRKHVGLIGSEEDLTCFHLDLSSLIGEALSLRAESGEVSAYT